MKLLRISFVRFAFAAAYFSTTLAAAPFAAAPAAAEQPGSSVEAKANHCIGCHNIPGYRSVFPEIFPVPKIEGQSAQYIEYALKAYRSGARQHPSMNAIAAQLSDADIKALAQWYAADPGPGE